MNWKKQALKLRTKSLWIVAIAVQVTTVLAQESGNTAPPAQVRVTGSMSDTQTRRDFVAGKIIIGRKRIEDSGVRTVEELLKREPAVTVRGDGRIGLLNMPGYTQVLVDGQQPTAGQSPSQLDLVHIEKIEIIKSSVAEYGPFGIAGTINIVTRKTVRKTATQLSNQLSSTAGKLAANVSLSHNQSTVGSPLRFSMELSGSQAAALSHETRIRQTLALSGQGEQEQSQATIRSQSRSPYVSASANVSWQRSADETIMLSPEFFATNAPSRQDESRRWTDASTLDVQQESTTSLTMFSLPFKWSFRPSKKSSLNLSLRSHLSRMENQLTRSTSTGAAQSSVRNSEQHTDGHTNSVNLDYRIGLAGGQDLKTGISLRRSAADVGYDFRIDGQPDPTLTAQGTQRQSVSQYLQLFVQDEWRINEHWALNAGISGQDNVIDVTESLYRGRTSFRLWSPSLHVSKKIGNDDKRQLRFSLARSFKAPRDIDFTVRPDINPLAPCPANGMCGANTIDTADKSGNPGLRPERALGLNLEYEHGIGDDSQITLELFTRRIDGKIGTDIRLDSVPWAAVPRYVARPTNLGDARSSGVNLEMELALRDLDKRAPQMTLRGSAGVARSRVSSLPGPDNRLDQQTPWTAKLGASYTLHGLPLKFDVDADWSPSVWARTSLSERVAIARLFELDASARWAMNKDQRIVLSFKTRSPRSAQQINEYIANDEQVRLYTDTKKYSTLSVKFDTKL